MVGIFHLTRRMNIWRLNVTVLLSAIPQYVRETSENGPEHEQNQVKTAVFYWK